LLFVLIGGVLSPVTEEIFFRGILYGFFRRWGVFIALVLSTGIFLLAHPLRSGIPVPQLVGGILFAVAYEVEGCLMVPITIHCLGNLSIFSISLVF
jgi:membrane protease YdiL (CAAX protease family)